MKHILIIFVLITNIYSLDINDVFKVVYSSDPKLDHDLRLQESEKIMSKLVKNGDPIAIFISGNRENSKKAFKIFKAEAKKGNIESKFFLALSYFRGFGTLKDCNKAFKILNEISNVSGSANYVLGRNYTGKVCNTKENLVKKFNYYKKSEKLYMSNKNKSSALYQLSIADTHYRIAKMYYYGAGTKKDLKKAFKYYYKVYNNRYARFKLITTLKIAKMYIKGEGTLKDLSKAALLTKEAYENYNDSMNRAEKIWNEYELWKHIK